MITMLVAAPGLPQPHDPEHVDIVQLCRYPMSVAEIAAKLNLPLAVVKILIGDLIQGGFLLFTSPLSTLETEVPDMNVLRAVLDGIRRL